MIRIGFGTDIHRLKAGRPLVVGGVAVESDVGADGHSDADVLYHAMTDSLLGALGKGDIGTYFPSSDDRWRNADSEVFLVYAAGLAREARFAISNVDAVITLERPKLLRYIERIRESLANALGVAAGQVNIKAKTNEGIGALGRCEAIRAEVVVLLESERV